MKRGVEERGRMGIRKYGCEFLKKQDNNNKCDTRRQVCVEVMPFGITHFVLHLKNFTVYLELFTSTWLVWKSQRPYLWRIQPGV